MTYTKTTKGLAILLAVCMLAVMLPAFLSFAATTPGPYDESFVADPDTAWNEKISASDNLALGAIVSSQYGAHDDSNWSWNATYLTDGTTNYTYKLDIGETWQVGNGGYHSYPHTAYGNSGLAAINHEEWITIDMGELKTFTTVELYPCRDGDGICRAFPNTFDVDVSVDGTNWLNVAHVGNVKYEAGEYAPTIVQFDEVTAQYVRVNVFSMSRDINGKFFVKLSELAVFNRARDAAYCPNYALDAELSHSDAHHGGYWVPASISDGNRYNVNFDHANQKDFGQYVGWHTTTAPGTDPAWVAFTFEEAKKVDRVMVWPSTELYTEGGAQGLYLPTSFVIQTSTDGAEWNDVTTFSDIPATYQPITIDFDAVTTQYIRVYMPRTGAIKLSEIEVYDSTALVLPEVDDTIIEERDVNLALNADPIYCGVTPAAGWDPSYLNNGILEDAGFTTNENPATPYVGYRFEHKTKLNKIVLYSSLSNAPEDLGAWSGVPKCFTVEYTVDGLVWNTATAVANTTPPAAHEALEIVFGEIVAKEVRINASELYPKLSDLNKKYIQLSEMEVWYTDAEATLAKPDVISTYLQTRASKDGEGNVVAGYSDLRVVLVGNLEALATVGSATVTLTFELDGVVVKTLTKQLGGADNDYIFYKSITADGEVYTAADGSAIFGNIITDIPDGAYDALSLTVVDNADPSNILYSGSTN